MAANPWNIIRMPNAFVNFSSPIRSTAISERSAEKQAADKNNV